MSSSLPRKARPPEVLIVDDEPLLCRALARRIERAGYVASTAPDADEAIARIRAGGIDMALVDLRLRGADGAELIERAHQIDATLPCAVLTAHPSANASLAALRAGAFWFIEKPFDPNLDEVVAIVEAGLASRRVPSLAPRLAHGTEIVGRSDALRSVLEIVDRVADRDATVLLTGESGTGKELIARALHERSQRASGAFVAVNCGAIPEQLLESELFGHVRGSFTHAVRDRDGRFALADGGSLFLDEIGDMTPALQVKLLRVLQDGRFEPVGASRTREVDVRVIAATHQNLEVAMREGRFRADLFYRLNVIPIELPPLRERREDIAELVNFFLRAHAPHADAEARSAGQSGVEIASEALDALIAHDWPGNVRELENQIERLVVLRRAERIELSDLPASFRNTHPDLGRAPRLPETGLSFSNAVSAFEANLIRQALERTDWNKSQAARLLGMNRTTFLEMVKKRGIAPRA